MDAKHLPESIYQSGPYDLILCSEVLEHVAKWDNVFANFITCWLRQDTLFSLALIFFHFMKSPMISGVPLLMPSDVLYKSMGSRLKQKRRSVPGGMF